MRKSIRVVYPILLFLYSGFVRAETMGIAVPKISIQNFRELCSSSKFNDFSRELNNSLPKRKKFEVKGPDDFDKWYKTTSFNNSLFKTKMAKGKKYYEKCQEFCLLMKPVKPLNEGFIYAGQYGDDKNELCQDRWIKKVRSKGNRVEFVWGITNRLEFNYFGPMRDSQKFSDKYLNRSTEQVNCSTWEVWDDNDKIWEPILSNTIIDKGSENFCKKPFYKFW